MFTNFHRKLYCLMDNWLGMTMEEIRVLEERNKIELAQVCVRDINLHLRNIFEEQNNVHVHQVFHKRSS